jgi:hypothetical protein
MRGSILAISMVPVATANIAMLAAAAFATVSLSANRGHSANSASTSGVGAWLEAQPQVRSISESPCHWAR